METKTILELFQEGLESNNWIKLSSSDEELVMHKNQLQIAINYSHLRLWNGVNLVLKQTLEEVQNNELLGLIINS